MKEAHAMTKEALMNKATKRRHTYRSMFKIKLKVAYVKFRRDQREFKTFIAENNLEQQYNSYNKNECNSLEHAQNSFVIRIAIESISSNIPVHTRGL